jgi:hypothetical protein
MPAIGKTCLFIILTFLFLTGSGPAHAQNIVPSQQLSINFSNSSIEGALSQLSTEQGILLSFDPSLVSLKRKINRNFFKTPLTEILDFLLSGTGLSYKYINKEIIIVPQEIKRVSLSGHVHDAKTGEDLIGAGIYIPILKQGISSNNYGFYSLTLPAGSYELWISHVGYVSKKITIDLQFSAQSQEIELEKQQINLHEIVVNSQNSTDSTAQSFPGQALEWELIKKQPYYKGEPDVIKALQMQNGILGMTEESSNMFIRGGNKDQNLILFDEATVYNPGHLFGLTSIFNPDALKNIQIYTDGIPPNFGGRLSSVIDARMADGDDKTFHVKGGASLLAARLALEGPIVKEKGSFLITGRKSLLNFLNKNFNLFNLGASYYDLNFKVNYKFGASDRVYYSAYFGNDRLKSNNGYFNSWGNQTSTLRWNHIFNARLFSNLSAIYSNYKNRLNINADASEGMDQWITGIRDFTLKGDFIYYQKPHSQIQFGFNGTNHIFTPGESNTTSSSSIPKANAWEYGLYASHKLSLGQHFRLLYGLRASMLQNISKVRLYTPDDDILAAELGQDPKEGYQSYLRLEPRMTIQYALEPQAYLQFTYNRNYQYLQLIQNDELAFSSLETWIPSSPNIKPQQSDLFSLEYRRKVLGWTFSLSAYDKKMLDQLQLIDHAQVILNPVIEDQLRSGRSDAYGIEFMASKDIGRLRGTLFYTWSRAFRKFNQINNSLQYRANYDIPHVLKLSLNYQITNRLLFSSFFTYTTGRPVTLPVGYFLQQGLKVPIYKDRNSSRMPDYNRLDLSVSWDLSPATNRKRPWMSSLSLGVYNVYGKKNSLFYRVNQNPATDYLVEEQAFPGITPAITYNFKF